MTTPTDDGDRVTARGFRVYGPGPIETDTGMPGTVEFRESSAAWSSSRTQPAGVGGPFAWLDVTDTYPPEDPERPGQFLPLEEPNRAGVHLTRAEVAELHARLGRWLAVGEPEPARLPVGAVPLARIEVVEYLDADGGHVLDVHPWTADDSEMPLYKLLGLLEQAKAVLSAPLLAELLGGGEPDA